MSTLRVSFLCPRSPILPIARSGSLIVLAITLPMICIIGPVLFTEMAQRSSLASVSPSPGTTPTSTSTLIVALVILVVGLGASLLLIAI